MPLTTLDSPLDFYRPPTLVKIDVEGAELLVLEGATRLLREIRPRLYIEAGAAANADVTTLLQRHSYQLSDGDAIERGPRDGCAFNTLAIPAECHAIPPQAARSCVGPTTAGTSCTS